MDGNFINKRKCVIMKHNLAVNYCSNKSKKIMKNLRQLLSIVKESTNIKYTFDFSVIARFISMKFVIPKESSFLQLMYLVFMDLCLLI